MRKNFASAKGALQSQPSAIGLGIVTHKITSSERVNQTMPPSPSAIGAKYL
jgi:hypothetical protein